MENSRCLKDRLSKVFTESQPLGFPKLLHQASSSPPDPGASIQQILSTTVRDGILKIGAKLPGFSLHRRMFMATYRAWWGTAVAVFPYTMVPACYCVHTVCKHKQEHRYRDIPARNTTCTGHGWNSEPMPKLEINYFFPSIKSEDLASQEYHRHASF